MEPNIQLQFLHLCGFGSAGEVSNFLKRNPDFDVTYADWTGFYFAAMENRCEVFSILVKHHLRPLDRELALALQDLPSELIDRAPLNISTTEDSLGENDLGLIGNLDSEDWIARTDALVDFSLTH